MEGCSVAQMTGGRAYVEGRGQGRRRVQQGHGEPDVSTPPQCETLSRWGPGPASWGRARTCGLRRRREGERFRSRAGTPYSWAHRPLSLGMRGWTPKGLLASPAGGCSLECEGKLRCPGATPKAAGGHADGAWPAAWSGWGVCVHGPRATGDFGRPFTCHMSHKSYCSAGK